MKPNPLMSGEDEGVGEQLGHVGGHASDLLLAGGRAQGYACN